MLKKGKWANSTYTISDFSSEIIATDKEEIAFKDLDAAILVGSMPRKEGMERKDLLKANVAIFKSQGSALEKFSKKTVKVLRSGFYNTIHLLGHYKSVEIQV